MEQIELGKGIWEFDESKPLGPRGGFGEVFRGAASNGTAVAVKRIFRQDKAARELELAEYLQGHDHPHVIPILDVGRDAGSGQDFIVMALAEQSLQDLVRKSAPLPESDALEITDAIATGLVEIGELVHRDLKPGNVLLHNGVWKIADLGLARFVEDSTSIQTMKGCLSPPYAAPEQWRNEHATTATDVYALGCIIFALMTGRPPFPGPKGPDFGHQHQYDQPPPLPASDRFRALASACLAKNQQLRPALQSVRAQIARARQSLTAPSSKLAQVGATLVEERAKAEAEAAVRGKTDEDRERLAQEAIKTVREILHGLIEAIRADAPTAAIVSWKEETATVSCDVRLGQGALRAYVFPYFTKYMAEVCNRYGWDVVAGAEVWVQMPPFELKGEVKSPVRGHECRSANLWFGKLTREDGYRWWEVSYAGVPGDTGKEEAKAPFSINFFREPDRLELAHNPRVIDGEHIDAFYDRWGNWLAQAAVQQFEPPRSLPEETIDPRFLLR
jgi:serine/threonine-protein kinase